MPDHPMTEPTITVHRKPPPYADQDNQDLGYLEASSDEATVTLACSLAMLDDQAVVDHFVKARLLLFHKLEVDRLKEQHA